MSGISELICTEEDGTLSFGNHVLSEKSKKYDYEHDGDLYKVKTFADITRLERNGLFVYESVPGTTVRHFHATGNGVSFEVEGEKDAQIILGMEDDAQYKIYLQDVNIGAVKTGMGGKLVLSVETGAAAGPVSVKVVKL
ncbi:MAG: endosialidase [Lachnospiraceae bacterium]|nr:endosialidase [Lachnospiraceae bacterium]